MSIPISHPPDGVTDLRIQLKTWERDFAKSHGGRKPTHDDIKQDLTIAAKYKEYHKLTKAPKPQPRPEEPSKSPHALPPPTPKRPKDSTPQSATPSRSTHDVPWEDTYLSPATLQRRRLFGPRATRDGIGPTPQKTGKVLGLFESFLDTSASPTKSSPPKPAADRDKLTETPSKRNVQRAPPIPSGGGDDEFSTPRKRKRGADPVPSPSKYLLETPHALRQIRPPSSTALLESPPAFRPPPPPKRGLSSMVAELRAMEDRALDEDEEVLREIEAEEMGKPAPSVMQKLQAAKGGLNEEPQLPPLPPGAYVEEKGVVEEAGAAEEQPQSRWKKRGLKRQTKRVKMRPVLSKPKPEAPAAQGSGKEPAGEEAEGVEESEEQGSGSGSDYEGDDGEGNEDEEGNKRPPKKAKTATSQDVSTAKGSHAKKSLAKKGKEVVKKAARKISATAHANFRKLNIKNKNSKARAGGRFGRRRR